VDNNACSIALYLYGESISLDGATKLLGLKPTGSRNKGDERTTSSGATVVQKIGFWEYRLKTSPDQVGHCLSTIVTGLSCERIVGVAGISKAEVDIFYPIDPHESLSGLSMEISSDLLGAFARLGFDLVVTVR
jgi:hypothetical protein